MTTVVTPNPVSEGRACAAPACQDPFCLACTDTACNIDDRSRYTNGDCYLLAHALHRITGWPMRKLIDPEYGQAVHAFVQMPDGNYLDVEGVCAKSSSSYHEYLSDDESPVVIKALTEDQLEEWGSPYHVPACLHSVAESNVDAERVAWNLLDAIGYTA